MTIQQILTDITSVLGALGVIFTVLAHIPGLPAAWAERFARFASYTSNAKFSVNQRENPKPPSVPTGMGVIFVLCCFGAGFANGCALFSPADYAHCLPSPAGLLADVAKILSGDSYLKDLQALAVAKGEAAVICAVQQFVEELRGKVGLSPDQANAMVRGKVWLHSKGVQ